MIDIRQGGTLRDFAGLQRGTTYKSKLLGTEGPWLLGLACIARNGGFKADNLRTYGGPSDPKILVGPGDILVSLKDVTQAADLLGSVVTVPASIGQGRLTQDTVKLVFDDDFSERNYIYWLLRTPQARDHCRRHATGTTNLGLAREDFLAIEVPPLDEGREILLQVLQALDDKIELNQRMNETLEAQARALFRDWFVDFGPVKAKMAGATPYLAPDLWTLFPDRLNDEGLPEGWKRNTLGEVLCVLETGKRPRGGVKGIERGTPSIGAESIEKIGVFDFTKTKFVPAEFVSKMAKGKVEDGDVLVYKDGGKPGELRPAVTFVSCEFPFSKFVINEHVFRLRSRKMSQESIYCILTTENAFWQMKERATGVAQPGLNQEAMKAIEFVDPCDDKIWKTIHSLVSPLFELCNRNALNSKSLAQTRDLLLPKLMSGEIRVGDMASEKLSAA